MSLSPNASREREKACVYESPLCLVLNVSALQRGEMAITLLTGVYRDRLPLELVDEVAGPAEYLPFESDVAGV